MEMKSITSRQNPLVVMLASLKEKKYREKHKSFLAEGIKLVEEAFLQRLPISHLLIAESKKESLLSWLAVQETPSFLTDENIYILSDACFEKISTEKSPQGIIAVIKYLDFFSRMDKINSKDVSARALFLSSVRDPGNLGAIIRSAVAFGTKTLLLSADSADVYHPKVLRAAMGSLFRLQVILVQDAPQMMETLQRAGRRFLAAEIREHAKPLDTFSIRENDIFVIGNEGHGIASDISALCDFSVYIPISPGVESLNASVAASLLIWEQEKASKRN